MCEKEEVKSLAALSLRGALGYRGGHEMFEILEKLKVYNVALGAIIGCSKEVRSSALCKLVTQS